MMRATSRRESFSLTHSGFGVITSRMCWFRSRAIVPPFLFRKEGEQWPFLLERDPQTAADREIAWMKIRAHPVVSGLEDDAVAAGDRKIRVHARGDAPGRARFFPRGGHTVETE